MFVVDLKGDNLINENTKKQHRYNAIVDYEFFERIGKCAHKREAVAIWNIACDVEGHAKPSRHKAHEEKTREADFVEVFRIQKQVRYAQQFPKTARDHGKKNNPTQK